MPPVSWGKEATSGGGEFGEGGWRKRELMGDRGGLRIRRQR